MDLAPAPAPATSDPGAAPVVGRVRRRAVLEAVGGLLLALAVLFVGTTALATWGEHLYDHDGTVHGIALWQARDWTPHLAPVAVLVLLATAEQTRRGRPRLVPALCAGVVVAWSAVGLVSRRVLEGLTPESWSEPRTVLEELALSGQWPGWTDPWAWRDEAGALFPSRREVVAGTELAGGVERVPHPGALTPLVLLFALLVVTWAGRRLGRSLPPGPPTATGARWLAVAVVGLPLGAAWSAVALLGGEDAAVVLPRDAVPAGGLLALVTLAVLSVGLGRAVWVLAALVALALLAPAFATWWQGGPDAGLVMPLAVAVSALAACGAVPLARGLHRFLPARA
ncbi:hypothetical protein [Cellulomonas massiliensis]|uniref:hypothetical protein n=1 Tax=Cellulomonas massiliensis TaxID=1465811 RepID=UPI0002EE6987|nr:hypothetical protein [Cellulomonas massiliensis]